MPPGVWLLSPKRLVCVCATRTRICLHPLFSTPSRHRPVAVAGTPGGSWQHPSLPLAPVTLQLILPGYGQSAASVSLASNLSLMRCISFLQAQLFVRPVFELLGRGDGTHQSDPGGGLGPRRCLGTMPLSHIYHLF